MRRSLFALMSAIKAITKMVAGKTDIRVLFQGDQAYTDGHTVVLPAIPVTDDMTPAQVRAFEVYTNGYADHEAAHVRYTRAQDAPSMEQPLHAFFNLIEDVVIERRLPEDFPGTRSNLLRVDQQLVADGKVQPATADDPPLAQVQSWLYCLWRSTVLKCTELEPLARQAEALLEASLGHAAMIRLKALAAQIDSVASTRDSHSLARRFVSLFEDLAKEDTDQAVPPPAGDGSGQPDSSAQSGQAAGGNDGASESDPDGGATPASASGQADDATDGQASCPQDGSASAQASSAAVSTVATDANTQGSATSAAASGQGQDGTGTDSAHGPDAQAGDGAGGGIRQFAEAIINATDDDAGLDKGAILAQSLNEISAGYADSAIDMAPLAARPKSVRDPELVADVRTATNAVRKRLQAFVESQRQVRRRRTTSGARLNMRAIHKLYDTAPALFVSRTRRPGIETAVLLLMDDSSSMHGLEAEVAGQSGLALGLALEAIPGVSVAAATFPAKAHQAGYLSQEGVQLITAFGEGVRATSRHYRLRAQIGSTPMAEAMMWAVPYLAARHESRKCLILLTDGRPNGGSTGIDQVRRLIEIGKLAGIETLGIGIGSQAAYVEALFDHSEVVNQLSDLPRVVFNLVGKSLTREAA